jgi:hypothetical protein
MDDDFIKSKAMVTPGAAGSATTMLTATLSTQLSLPPSWTGMAISFLFGTLTFADKSVPLLQRFVFYVINSITIFTVAMGINYAGMTISETRETKPPALTRSLHPESPEQVKPSFFHEWF